MYHSARIRPEKYEVFNGQSITYDVRLLVVEKFEESAAKVGNLYLQLKATCGFVCELPSDRVDAPICYTIDAI